jgi:HAD superfamily hydrolase (TIGR01509 family)
LIRAAIFDYGETLVFPGAPDQQIVPQATLAAFGVFVRAGLKTTFEDFLVIDLSIFGKWGKIESRENRDIPDIIKYHELVGRLFPAHSGTWRRRVASQANVWFWDVVARNYRLAKGAGRALDRLESMGLQMAVLSNHRSHRALVKHLKQLGLDRYFDRIFSSAQLGVRKPDPRAFEKCLSAFRVKGEETVFIGDSIKNDIVGAKACGMKAVLLEAETKGKGSRELHSTREPSPDFVVSTLSEVPMIVRRLNGGYIA